MQNPTVCRVFSFYGV